MKNTTSRIIKSRKGISPILATLLLVVIAVAAIVVTYAWITTYMGTATQQAGFIPYKANVGFTGTNQIKIDIGNSGTSSGQIVAIYVGTTATALTNMTTINPSLPQAVPSGEIVSFTVTNTWSTGHTYYFKVVPTSGAALSFSETV